MSQPGGTENRRNPTAESLPALELHQEIDSHRDHDQSRSWLEQAVGYIWHGDSASLTKLEQLEQQSNSTTGKAPTPSESEVEAAIAADRKALAVEDEISTYGAGMLKTAFLFARGKVGLAGTIGLYALDQINSHSTTKEKLVDLALGAAKGGLMRGAFEVIGSKSWGIALRGVSLGTTSRFLDAGLSRTTWENTTTGSIDLTGGWTRAASGAFNSNALIMDVAVMGSAHGLLRVADGFTAGSIARSPFLTNILTGGTYGFASGAGAEIIRENKAGERLNLPAILEHGLIQGTLDTIAASPGGVQSDAIVRADATEKFADAAQQVLDKAGIRTGRYENIDEYLRDRIEDRQRWAAAVRICADLQQAGHIAVLAGGCVRDQFLGRRPKDYDIATTALPEQVEALYSGQSPEAAASPAAGNRSPLTGDSSKAPAPVESTGDHASTGAKTQMLPASPPGDARAKTQMLPASSPGDAGAKTQMLPASPPGDAGAKTQMLPASSPSDADAKTQMPPASVNARSTGITDNKNTPKVLPTGKKHGVVMIYLNGHTTDVATLRADGDYSDGRRPDEVVYLTEPSIESLMKDAARRDTTINAMFKDPISGQLYDFYGGQKDLIAGVIRAVRDPELRILEDRLRMLRAARQSSELGFTLDPALEAAITKHASKINGAVADAVPSANSAGSQELPPAKSISASEHANAPKPELLAEAETNLKLVVNDPRANPQKPVSRERVRDELSKILTSKRPVVGLDILMRTGLLEHILPDVHALNTHLGEQDPLKHPSGNSWAHTRAVLLDLSSHQASFELMMAGLLVEVGKAKTITRDANGQISHPLHEETGAELARKICAELKIPNSPPDHQIDHIVDLVRWHGEMHKGMEMDSHSLADLLERRYIHDHIALQHANVLATGTLDSPTSTLRPFYQRMLNQLTGRERPKTRRLGAPPLVTGDLLLEMGYKSGSDTGKIIRNAKYAQRDGKFSTIEQAKEWIRKTPYDELTKEVPDPSRLTAPPLVTPDLLEELGYSMKEKENKNIMMREARRAQGDGAFRTTVEAKQWLVEHFAPAVTESLLKELGFQQGKRLRAALQAVRHAQALGAFSATEDIKQWVSERFPPTGPPPDAL